MPLAPTADEDASAKRGASRYDYVKVKVWIQGHSHVLSRFLVTRLLTAAGLQPRDALKVALQLKKQLVDRGALDVELEDLHRDLFAIVRQFEYEDAYVNRFRQMLRFYQLKRPMLVLIGGLGCLSAPSLGSRLAERLNVSNVLSTATAFAIASNGRRPTSWERPGSSSFASFLEECSSVRQALQVDLHKALGDGKATIIEGPHLSVEDMADIVRGQNAKINSSQRALYSGIVVPILLQLPPEWDKECLPVSSSPLNSSTCCPSSITAIETDQSSKAAVLGVPSITVNLWDYEETVQTMYSLTLAQIDVAIAQEE